MPLSATGEEVYQVTPTFYVKKEDRADMPASQQRYNPILTGRGDSDLEADARTPPVPL
jgi:hypothetical protein